VGSLSDLTCFSFHPRKSITTGEGGMITTGDGEVADRLRRLRSHGASTSDLARHRSGTLDFEEYPELGFNYRMTDVQAAIGVVQMGRLEDVLAARRRLALRYSAALAELDGVEVPYEPPDRPHTFQSYCVRLPSGVRSKVMADLAAAGVSSRRGVMAVHLEPFYRTSACVLPETERATANTLLLPLFAGMTDQEQDQVIGALASSVKAALQGARV
jgi:perosamine synthetase